MRRIVDLVGKLFEVIIKRGHVGGVLFPNAVVHQSLLVHIFFQQAIKFVVTNSGANIDIFAGLSVSAHRHADQDESEDDKENPEFHFYFGELTSAQTYPSGLATKASVPQV